MNEYQTRVITPPAVEPISLDEAQAHLRVDHDTDSVLIESLIRTAREQAELIARRALINRTLDLSLDSWPGDRLIRLPFPPLVSVTSVTYYDYANTVATMPNTDYIVVNDIEPGVITLAYDKSWPNVTLRPVAPVRVRYVAGYGTAATSVPQRYRQAILLLVGHWYEHREAVNVGSMANELPMAVNALLLGDQGW
jgi:uncharacterized phiE125 gp8 family phage protein